MKINYTLVKISDVNLLTTINYPSNVNVFFISLLILFQILKLLLILLWYILYIPSSGSRIQRQGEPEK